MKNVYILTWNGSGNYGTNLQAYALYRYIENLGFKCFMFSGNGKMTPLIFLRKAWNKFNKMIFKKIIISNNYTNINPNKEEKIQQYLKENFQVEKFNTKYKIKKLDEDSIFLIGSDQVWNPNYFNSVMLLDFLPNDFLRRYSYASSVGIDVIPKKYKNKYKKYLNKFKLITVREETSQKAIEEVISVNKDKIKCVVDPTFLLSEKEWKNFAQTATFESDIPEKFILCYFVGNRDFTESVKEITDCYKGIAVLQVTESSDGFILQYGQPVPDAGPKEFVWLIKHATLILTDSFHATAISIVFKRDFFVFKRFNDNDKKSQNGRLKDILNKYDLTSREYIKKFDYKNIRKNIDYTNVYNVLEPEIIESKRLLKNMLDGIYD